jgi:cytochrome o ubiquinol oxidase subunit IV
MDQKTLPRRIVGFLLSLLLSFCAYFIILHPGLFQLRNVTAVQAILLLAALQSFVQFVFFLDVWREKGALWNLGFFVSTISIICIIIFFSIWIMDNLNYNMMP